MKNPSPAPPRHGEGVDDFPSNPAVHIVCGQPVTPSLKARSRELRQAATAEEQRLWQELRAHRSTALQFRRQQVIGLFIVDFYCHAARLIVEVDGGIHRIQRDEDRSRDEWLKTRGFRVLRVTNDDVMGKLSQTISVIASLVRARTTPSPRGGGMGRGA